MIVQKGGQVTKPIIVKMPCKLLYVIQVKGFLIKCSTSWPYLISEFLVAYNHCGFCLALFLQPGCFCLAYHCFCKYSKTDYIIINKKPHPGCFSTLKS